MTDVQAGNFEASLDRWRSDLEHGTFPFQVLNDDEVHAAELERIFGRSWLALGHENEIPEPGDYMLRYLGEDEVIVSRTEDNRIHVMLNSCRHRGTALCREEKGHATSFRCPYHGWVYRNDGEWAGAPKKTLIYREFDPTSWGLLQAPKVDTRWGVIFACLDPNAPTLEEFLGDFAFFADAFLAVDSRGFRLLSEPSRWIAHSNWKSSPENVVGDGFHAAYLHRSAQDVGLFPPIAPMHDHFSLFNAGNGHGLLGWNLLTSGVLPPGSPPWGYLPDIWGQLDRQGLSDRQQAFVEDFMPLTMTIFPNLSFARLPAFDPATGMPAIYTFMRITQPNGPGQHISWNYFMNYAVEPESFGTIALRGALQWIGAAGIGDIDDSLAWEGAARAGRSVFARSLDMQMNYQMGLGDMSACTAVEGWDGPGVAVRTAYTEMNQRAFWSEWLDRMQPMGSQP